MIQQNINNGLKVDNPDILSILGRQTLPGELEGSELDFQSFSDLMAQSFSGESNLKPIQMAGAIQSAKTLTTAIQFEKAPLAAGLPISALEPETSENLTHLLAQIDPSYQKALSNSFAQAGITDGDSLSSPMDLKNVAVLGINEVSDAAVESKISQDGKLLPQFEPISTSVVSPLNDQTDADDNVSGLVDVLKLDQFNQDSLMSEQAFSENKVQLSYQAEKARVADLQVDKAEDSETLLSDSGKKSASGVDAVLVSKDAVTLNKQRELAAQTVSAQTVSAQTAPAQTVSAQTASDETVSMEAEAGRAMAGQAETDISDENPSHLFDSKVGQVSDPLSESDLKVTGQNDSEVEFISQSEVVNNNAASKIAGEQVDGANGGTSMTASREVSTNQTSGSQTAGQQQSQNNGQQNSQSMGQQSNQQNGQQQQSATHFEQAQRQQAFQNMAQDEQLREKSFTDLFTVEKLKAEKAIEAEKLSSDLSLSSERKTQLPLGLQSIAQPIRHPQWGQALGQRVVYMANSQIQEAKITLNPEKLGPVQVKLQLDKEQQLHVSMTAQHSVTREAMENALPRLREMLESAGIQYASLDVADQRSFERSDQEAEDNRGRASSGIGQDTGESVTEETVVQSVSDNLIDYYA